MFPTSLADQLKSEEMYKMHLNCGGSAQPALGLHQEHI